MTKPLHIVHLADAVLRDLPGGSRRAAREIALQMAAQKHRLRFVVPRLRPELPAAECVEGVSVLRFGDSEALRRPQALQRAFQALHVADPVDAVFVHFAYSALGYHQMPLSRSIPTVRVFHGPWDRESAAEGDSSLKSRLSWRVKFEIDKYSLHRSHRVVALSEFMARDVVDRFGVPAERVRVIPGGVNLDEFQPGDTQAARARLGLPPDALIVFTARRLVRRMGLDRLIEAAALARPSLPNLRVIIGGKGDLHDELSALIARRGLSECVQMAGFIPEAQFADYYRAADVFVLPTVSLEGFGLIILEALACNTPVLGTPVGAIPEVLSAFDPALVLPGTAPAEIAQGLVRFVQNRGTYAGDYRATVTRRFTWERMAEGLLADLGDARQRAER